VEDKIKIAIVGLGKNNQAIILPHLKKINNVSVQAIADINEEKLKTVSKKFNIDSFFSDYRTLLSSIKIDAAIISTPSLTHKEIVSYLIENNIPQFITKPIFMDLKDAILIKKSGIAKKSIIMIDVNLRFRQDVMLLKSIILSGSLGRIYLIKCTWLKKTDLIIDETKPSNIENGVIYNLSTKLLDLILWLLDFPVIKSVTTHNFNLNIRKNEDVSISFLRTEISSILIETKFVSDSKNEEFNFEIYGTQGKATLNPLRVYHQSGNNKIDYSGFAKSSQEKMNSKSYQNQLKHFFRIVKKGKNDLSTFEENIEELKIIRAMYESAELKREIIL